jgi:hypothetical protein
MRFSPEVEIFSARTEEAESTAARMEPTTQTVVKTEEKVDKSISFLTNSLTLQTFLGKYCCTNGANNPNCEIPTTTRRPAPTTTFKGPPYLPVATKSTTRGPTTIDTYTYGSRPTNTYRYSWTHGAWSGGTRTNTVSYTPPSTTPKYEYSGNNGIRYIGENDI